MRTRTCQLRVVCTVASVLLALAAIAPGCAARDDPVASQSTAPAPSTFLPDPARLAAAQPGLRERLVASPIALFRFVNKAWTHEACGAFAGDLQAMPIVRLHGDAHVEQYAVTATARGLDDFDDAARGPAIVDIIRFLASLELTARDRGWTSSVAAIVDGFFDGYGRALEDPSYLPADPAVVARLRAAPGKTSDEFLAWADGLMQPLTPDDRALVDRTWARVEANAAEADPEFTPAFLARKKLGALRLGIGSALVRKILIRVEGPSPAFADDVVLEVKEVTPLRGEPCLTVPRTAEVLRVVEGVRQIGRLEHRLVLALPALPGDPGAPDWWVKTWERSYQELEIANLQSAQELREIAHDVGAQLGGTSFLESVAGPAGRTRLMDREVVMTLQPRIRRVAGGLTAALLDAWHQFSRH